MTSLRYFPPTEGGKALELQEVLRYLEYKKIPYDVKVLGQAFREPDPGKLIPLNNQKILPVAECSVIYVSDDRMSATAVFYPPSAGTAPGRPLTKEEIYSECRLSKVMYGVDEKVLEDFLGNRRYCTEYTIAHGLPVKEGKDAEIIYHFNTDHRARPTLNEDGTVDFFHLNLVNHCKAGDVLAELIPEVQGTPGKNVLGEEVKPRIAKRKTLDFGLNIQLSEDKCSISSRVNGHVTLTTGRVFVSDVMEVNNVDNSTGNIDYDGNVVVAGNVKNNFSIKTSGDIEVRGSVEGAVLEAGGNITLMQGINGMGKGVLKAGGNIISKFLENCTVEAKGYVETNSILHSKVQAGTEINVMSRKGFITGGSVTATGKVRVKTLGSTMGADTLVTVGVDPSIINRMGELNKAIAEADKMLKSGMPLLDAMKKRLAAGTKFTPDQVKQLQAVAASVKAAQETMTSSRAELESLQEVREEGSRAAVEVSGEVYPGTVIAIGDVSMMVREPFKYCRFIYDRGDVRMAPL